MADEFVDFYQALGLPLEAEPKQIRSRIAEVYTEAQRNLDHRNFQTRVEHQKMFEVVLPRARYILLDEGRRGEYNQLVRAFRGASLPPASAPVAPAPVSTDLSSTSTQAPAFGKGDASSFRLAEEQAQNAAGKAPRVEGLPTSSIDPEQMARQRDELWLKWKSGLESAIALDETSGAAAKSAPSNPTSSPPSSPVKEAPPKPKLPRAPAAPIAFDFGADNAARRGEGAPVPGAEELVEEAKQRLSPEEMERARIERKREAMREILTTVGVKAVLMGSLGAGVPLIVLLVVLMGHFYPNNAQPLLGLPSPIAWCLGLAIVIAAGYFAAHTLSRSLRHKRANELATMSLEDILRELGRAY